MNQIKTMAVCGTFAAVLFALFAPSGASGGQSITFIHEGTTTSGFVLDGQGFPGTYDFIITALGDVGDREELPRGNGWFIDHTGASIEIVGFGTLVILTPTRTFMSNSAQSVGFSRAGATGADLFNGPTNAAFFEWEMTTSIGPIAGNDGRLTQWAREPFIETTGGRLEFDDEQNVPVIFTAEVVVPGPGPMALLPLAAIHCPSRRRRWRC